MQLCEVHTRIMSALRTDVGNAPVDDIKASIQRAVDQLEAVRDDMAKARTLDVEQ